VASIQDRETASGHKRHAVLYRHNGKQTSVTFTRKKDAIKACNLINALGPDEALQRLYSPTAKAAGDWTVSAWLDKHIEDLTGVTDRTRADYRRLAARHIAPTIGVLDLDEVQPADVSTWAKALEKHMSDKSLANLRALLSAAFGYAVDEGLRTDNPMRRLRRSRASEHERPDMVFLTTQEFARLKAMVAEFWRPFVTFLVGTGLRFGEAVALTVGDADLLAPTPVVRVTKALKRAATGFEIGPPKSRRSRRSVELSTDVVDLLLPHVAGRDSGEFLFTTPAGGRISHSNFYNRTWLPAVRQFQAEAGKKPRVHDLRHSHAAWCIERGMHLEAIRDRLGHESITTTQIYSHISPQQRQLNAAMLNGLLADERV
jgi:integrase